MSNHRFRWQLAALTVALIIASTACNSSKPEEATATNQVTVTTTATATAPATPTTTPIADPSASITTAEPTSTATRPAAEEEPSEPPAAMDDVEAEAANRLSARRDLEVAATATSGDDGTFVIDAAVRVLDRSSVLDPTLVLTPGAGIQIVDPLNECTMVGADLECVLGGFFSQPATDSGLLVPTDWLPLTLTATVDAGAPKPHEISITAVSRDNGLDNDPDPTNNTVTLDLSP